MLVDGLCDISTMGGARVGRWSIRGARGGGYRRGCAVARGGARGDDSARRQKSRCAGAKGSDALPPRCPRAEWNRCVSCSGQVHGFAGRAPLVGWSLGRVVLVLLFCVIEED